MQPCHQADRLAVALANAGNDDSDDSDNCYSPPPAVRPRWSGATPVAAEDAQKASVTPAHIVGLCSLEPGAVMCECGFRASQHCPNKENHQPAAQCQRHSGIHKCKTRISTSQLRVLRDRLVQHELNSQQLLMLCNDALTTRRQIHALAARSSAATSNFHTKHLHKRAAPSSDSGAA